jgi:DNA-directed RNA polymerase subunit beta'
VAQDVIITEEDCATLRGIDTEALKDNENVIETLASRIVGRYSLYDVTDPVTDEVLVEAAGYISPEISENIEKQVLKW